eukprot:scaffold12216_cov60-Phaeocystis_antarctica.AAC.2
MNAPRKLARIYGLNLLRHVLFKTAASIQISLNDISTPKLSPHLSKNRERTVLARIQPQLLFIPSYFSRTLLWTPLSVPPASAPRERKQPNGGGVLRVERRVEMVRSTRKAKAQCLPRRRLCTVQPRAAREATARVRCFLGVGAAAGARGARRGWGDGRGRGAVVPCFGFRVIFYTPSARFTHIRGYTVYNPGRPSRAAARRSARTARRRRPRRGRPVRIARASHVPAMRPVTLT